ncbi:MAG TPA: hypothetical protein H9729_01145 [Candidatus Borkfalkia excrementigallinarum]|uniref:Uncharacterized protein n=1 Tax=Candidatus Borkfalkia excrementigallinarum TaxID=2838506 RepID=A0A9D2CSI6_9FIRM|nr:hypothetical protein [Candidatus Borkfalkia excrementigallinarum]
MIKSIETSVHENLGELSPAVFRDLRATPPFKRSAFSAAFSPLFAPFFRAHLFVLSLSSRKGAAESRDFEGCRPQLAIFKGFYLLF